MRQNIITISRLVIVSLLVCCLTVGQVSALDESFYSSNDILYYDPTEVCTTDESTAVSMTDVSGDNNAEKILQFFVDKGLSLAVGAGFAGNMKQESGLNPSIIQGGATAPDNYIPKGGVGFGLVQWTSSGRQQGLVLFSKAQNIKITDLGLQLEYTWKELNTGYKTSTLDKLKNVTDPVEAAIIIHDNYEISADSDQTVRDVRGGNAKAYFNRFKNSIDDKLGITPASSQPNECGDSSSDDGGIGMIDGFVFPLKTTQANLKKGADGSVWCSSNNSNCHHDYNAADIFAETGTPIVAAAPGVVVGKTTSDCGFYGCNVTIKGSDGFLYYYTHMNKQASVNKEQKITAGQTIGLVGTNHSAMDTPRHLHFDMLPTKEYTSRPGCSSAACTDYPFINVQKFLVPAYNALPAGGGGVKA